MKGKILLASMIAVLAILVLSPATNALTNISVYGYTDKTNYTPGDTVTVNVFIYESGTDTINLINVTVSYPWYSIVWGGNQTVSAKNTTIAQGENWNLLQHSRSQPMAGIFRLHCDILLLQGWIDPIFR